MMTKGKWLLALWFIGLLPFPILGAATVISPAASDWLNAFEYTFHVALLTSLAICWPAVLLSHHGGITKIGLMILTPIVLLGEYLVVGLTIMFYWEFFGHGL
jgi:hypothetical protein